jgi:ATP-dependent Lon protease
VLPIGGVKEKSLAASRAGIKTILLPAQNQRDMEEVDTEVKKKCRFEFVSNVDEVLEAAVGKEALHEAIKRVARHHRKSDAALK